MTAKEELIQALLNTSNISAEATELLNNIVNGESSGGGALMVELSSHEELDGIVYTANKTAGEILDAIKAGKNVIWHFPDDVYTINKYGYEVGTSTTLGMNKEITSISFDVCWQDSESFDQYLATSLDDYPSCTYD